MSDDTVQIELHVIPGVVVDVPKSEIPSICANCIRMFLAGGVTEDELREMLEMRIAGTIPGQTSKADAIDHESLRLLNSGEWKTIAKLH